MMHTKGWKILLRPVDSRFPAYDPLTVAAGLLPVVEQVEPERLAECLGRTLALRPASGDQSDPGNVPWRLKSGSSTG